MIGLEVIIIGLLLMVISQQWNGYTSMRGPRAELCGFIVTTIIFGGVVTTIIEAVQ